MALIVGGIFTASVVSVNVLDMYVIPFFDALDHKNPFKSHNYSEDHPDKGLMQRYWLYSKEKVKIRTDGFKEVCMAVSEAYHNWRFPTNNS